MKRVSYILLILTVSVFFIVLTVTQSFNVKNILQMKKTIFTRTINEMMADVLTEIYLHYNFENDSRNFYEEKAKCFYKNDSIIKKNTHIILFKEINKKNRDKQIVTFLENTYPEFFPSTKINYKNKIFPFKTNKTNNLKGANVDTLNSVKYHIKQPTFSKTDVYYIDSVIKSFLVSYQMNESYEFGIYSPTYHKYFLYSNEAKLEEISTKGLAYKCDIHFSSQILPAYFVIYFPNQNNYLSDKSNMVIAISIVMIIILYGLFLYTILTTIEYRKIQKSRDDFVNNMTHEFKTPIATILLASEALKDDDIIENEVLRENYLSIISLENKRLENMVETILSNATAKKHLLSKLNLEVTDINILVEEAINLIQVILEQKQGRIICLKARNPLVYVDKEKMVIAIKNLLDNAIKYTRQRPVIRIEITNKKNKIIISVADNGIGIQRNYYNKIFDRLFRVSTGNVHNVKGYGLGLNYVKAIVRLHEGEVKVESQINKGSTFKIYLPVKQNTWKQKEKF